MRILAVSSGEKSADSICSLVRECGENDVTPCTSASAARRLLLDEAWDIAIINYPLSDESGMELGSMISNETSTATIMLIKDELISSAAEAEDAGLIVVGKPIVRPVFRQALHLAFSFRRKIAGKEERIRKLEMKIDELKAVDKAKCILVGKKGLSEDEAHRYILKLAMDKRISAKDAAFIVLRENR